MKVTFSFLISLLAYTNIHCQVKARSVCDSLIQEGYTSAFCEYNAGYAYKNIPFECNLSFLSAKMSLVKAPVVPNTYLSTDIDYVEWDGLTFDYVVFKFSAKDKLESVLLKLKPRTDNDSLKVKENYLQTANYLKHLFGQRKPTPYETEEKNNLHWWGNKINISFGLFDRYEIDLLIERRNVSELDNL
jgi:hypothetical protein